MVVNMFEYAYNGLVLGGATSPFQIDTADGFDMTDVALLEADRSTAHGAFTFGKYAKDRHPILGGDMAASDPFSFAQAEQTFRTSLAPQAIDLPLEYWLQGWPNSRFINCIPYRRAFQINPLYSTNYMVWNIEFVAGDPRIYDTVLQTALTAPLTVSPNGVAFPVAFPANFGGGSSGSILATNSGSIATSPIIDIYGPAINPLVTNLSTNEKTLLSITIAAGDFIEVDYGAMTVMLNGLVSRYSALDASSVWWGLQPGTTQVSFICSGGTAATQMVMKWRSAWM